jgi:hypothetical protein
MVLLVVISVVPGSSAAESVASQRQLPHVLRPIDRKTATTEIEFTIDPRYDNSDESIEELRVLIPVIPKTLATVQTNEGIANVTTRLYGFGDGDPTARRTYDLVAGFIREWNRLDASTPLRPGPLLVPTLPHRIVTPPDQHHDRTNVFTLGGSAIGNISILSEQVIQRAMPPTVPDSKSTGDAIVKVRVDDATGVSLLRHPGLRKKSTISRRPLRLILADCPDQVDDFRFTPADETQLHAMTRAPKKRSATVVVFDTGWPSADEFNRSRAAFQQILSTVQSYLRQRQTTVTLPGSYEKSRILHCNDIARGLAPFVALGGDQPEILYLPVLPLSAGDRFTRAIFEHALTIQNLLQTKDKRSKGEEWMGVDSPDEKTWAAAAKDARELVQALPPLAEPIDAQQPVVEAVARLLKLYSRAKSPVDDVTNAFFLSESWTLQNHSLAPRPLSPVGGAIFAAAGNNGIDIYAKSVDFASRALADPSEFVAVLNTTSEGKPKCTSAVIPTDNAYENEWRVIAFDGGVASRIGGTSISAPRVAWLFALQETRRNVKVSDKDWLHNLKARIVEARDGVGLKRFYCDIKRLVSK